jgi:uncharacterized protein HemX
MKQIAINLLRRKPVKKKLPLPVLAVLAAAALGFTLVNFYEYTAANTVIAAHESRLVEINRKQARRKQAAEQNRSMTDEQHQKIQEELAGLLSLVHKNMFPVLDVLTRIEKKKPSSWILLRWGFPKTCF